MTNTEGWFMAMNTAIDDNCMSAELYETDWKQLDWNSIERYVFKLQQRIYRAEAEYNYRLVRSLQRLLVHSNACLLLGIKRVTSINKGKRTAGLDDYRILTNAGRMQLFYKLQNYNIKLHKSIPVRRIYIPKKNGKTRPLGIPTIIDRIYQQICSYALEPAWESKFEATSYGFRPKRGCHDAITKIYQNTRGLNRPWIFEGDFKSCFDTLDHDYILKQLGNFPYADIINSWLKSGYIYNNCFSETKKGTPQGGIISPLLANIALHGMEEVLGIEYKKYQKKNKSVTYFNYSRYVFVRYADDFVILCKTREDAQEIYTLLESYLAKRGLTLSPEKTKITHIKEGFDFLGFNIRSYKTQQGIKVYTKPSKDSIKNFKIKVSNIIRKAWNGDIQTLIESLNYLIIGTANYWRIGVSSKIFTQLDHYIWFKLYKLLHRWYSGKSHKWIKIKHYKSDKKGISKDKYIFTDPETGMQVHKMSWISIKRHYCIKYCCSPYNAEDKEYFLKRYNKQVCTPVI